MRADRSVREARAEVVTRVRVLSGLLSALMVVILGGFWFVQMVQGELYRQRSEENRLREQRIEPLRGTILDRNGKVLAENVASYNLLLNVRRTEDLDASLRFAAEILGATAEDLRRALERRRGPAGFAAALIFESLSLEEVARFGVVGLEHPEFEIGVSRLRLYRYGPQTAHVLGYLGEVTEEELAAETTAAALEGREPAYRVGDQVGRRGVERTYESFLRGKGGFEQVVVDSRGRLVEKFVVEQAQQGWDLRLTLDLELQKEAQALMEDHVGAVVALDPDDGAIRAMVSSPSYAPNLFSRRLRPDDWQQVLDAPHNPLQNRAVQNTYPPGSVFKIAVAMAALADGVAGPGERTWCNGSTTLYNHRFRCWKRTGHGWMDLEGAIQHSCDVYFYHLGQKLGLERIARFSRRFGLGERTGVDLGDEKPGLVPSQQWSLTARGTPWFPGETISVSVGQGALLTTPLQQARLMAMVANGGYAVRPHLLGALEPPAGFEDSGREVPRPPGRPAASVPLDPRHLERVRRALLEVVEGRDGTGGRARVEGLRIAGKTGTAQVVRQLTWTRSEDLPYERRDHAWFASYAPFDDPRLVVVVFVEHGGKGSETAAPIARKLYEKFFRSHLDDHGDL